MAVLSLFLRLVLLVAGSRLIHGQLDRSSLSLRDKALALRDEHFRSLDSGKATSQSTHIQRRDLKPSTPGTSYHWAGSVVPPPAGENITTVTATMTLPDLTEPEDVRVGPAGEYFLYVWVGIDGLESVDPGECDALWQTGFAGQIKNGVTTWWGWVC